MAKLILNLAMVGGDPVLVLLIILSVISVAFIFEKIFFMRKIEKELFSYTPSDLRSILNKRLGFFATVGSNAPFIGLFGTVLGIMKAFHDLAISQDFGVRVVMNGIAEALSSTALGLFVAVPCVIAYNYFVRKARDLSYAYEEHINNAQPKS
ncbi:outer membrane transport energization protein ExbB [Thermodesulfobium acidiphilum]|uniref:Outer membrane transport energization protein ExbB n=1 Tax=Thermodesulfobium acidiphilum TaxID=1794699 RepID=A0A2R4W1Y2_THEAF|nr:MotA/TolQ/ExbB proton channel family protein [Thermodesulfobium acidiphilum]AWB10730.1 outer membrane transport energization protein ExbB [Thermodesulfobium acidiphilum]